PGASVVVRAIVEERKPRLLERLQIAPNRPRRHAARRRELVDGDPARPRALDLAKDGPLADHFGVARHEGNSTIAGWWDCRIAGRKVGKLESREVPTRDDGALVFLPSSTPWRRSRATGRSRLEARLAAWDRPIVSPRRCRATAPPRRLPPE